MEKGKKVLYAIISCLLILSLLVGCSASKTEPGADAEKTATKFPEKPINLIVSFSAGGITDVGARILMPYVEKELGVPINVINKTGGGGWVGWGDFLSSPNDGYTLAYINVPNLITGYLDPQQKRDKNLDDLAVIANHVVDYGAIAINPKETRFANIQELIEYAKTHETTATTGGILGDDHLEMLRMNKILGTKFVPVNMKGTPESAAAVMGGHVDVFMSNVGSVKTYSENGELKMLAVLASERSEFFPDTPTLKEAVGVDLVAASARGIAALKGTDPAVLDVLTKAFEKGINNPEHIEKLRKMGLATKYIERDEYMAFLKNEEQKVKDISDLLGWK